MANLGNTFDANTVEPNTPFQPLPPGRYPVQIVASELRPTKDGMGQMLWLEMDVLEGPFAGRKLFDRLNLVTVSAVDEIVRHGADRRAWLIFCSGVDHAFHVRDAIRGRGFSCEAILGETPPAERDQIIAGYKRGEIRCLTNANVLTTGFNAPGVDLIAMLRPTKSVGLYVQMIGRGTRLSPGKDNCLVLDFAGNVARHGPIDCIDAGKHNKDDEAGILGNAWPHAGGTEMGLSRLAIDTGYEAPAVYAWARRMGSGQVVAVKGIEGFNRAAPVSGPTYVDATESGRKIRRGAKLWTIAVATFKSETYRFLRSAAPTGDGNNGYSAGYVHLPHGIEVEWVKQLVAEQLVTVRTKRGFTRLEWQKLRERNEVLDCRVYARAAAWIVGIDRWHERKWRDLEAQLGIKAKAEVVSKTASQEPTKQKTRAEPRVERRAVRSRWLGDRTRNWLQRY